MRPSGWRRSTYVVVGASVLLLVVVLVAAAALVAGRQTPEQQAVEPAPAPATAAPGVVPVSDSADMPTPGGLTAALRRVVADPNLGRFTGRITDALTGEELWAQGASLPMQPASTNKVLTAAAALLTLDRDARVTTRVVSPSPGVVVLVGGGDQTLSAAPR
ncbi:D-alanyl-D-alanine carboxypeptidase, partial [Mycobacterium sp. ITM-2017-0098]